MDVDGDSSFSSGDLENIGNADDVSTKNRERTNQLGDWEIWRERIKYTVQNLGIFEKFLTLRLTDLYYIFYGSSLIKPIYIQNI